MKKALAASAALLLAVLVGGCSGEAQSQEQDPVVSPRTSPSATPTPATSGIRSPEDLPAEPVFAGTPQGVIADVEVESCDTRAGDVVARGSVTNSADVRRDIAVTMSWTVAPTDDVVARGGATFMDLEPGSRRDWTIRSTVPGSTDAACVPSAQAGRLEG